MAIFVLAVALAALIAVPAHGHGIYPAGSIIPAEEDCRSFTSDVTVVSHHIHLFRDSGSGLLPGAGGKEQPIEPASEIFSRLVEAFNITQECDSWIGHDARRCAFNLDGSFGSDGPGWYFLPTLPDKNWAVSLMPSDFGAVMQWIAQNRCVKRDDPNEELICYDVLVHPNTGCLLNDHKEWGAWFGKSHNVVELGLAPCLHGCGPTTQPGCNGLGGGLFECDTEGRGGCCGDAWVRDYDGFFNGGYPDRNCTEDGNVLCPAHPDTWERVMEAARSKPNEYGVLA